VPQEEEMVQRLLNLKALADQTIASAFVDEQPSMGASTSAPAPTIPNQEFVYALGDAFTTGFKARRNKPAEMIAKFIDKTMRKGQGNTTDADFEALLDSTLGLYRYTDDKDVFRTFYHRQLAKRLLLDKSASIDFEKSMLKKMKEQYDPEFGMATDMFKDLTLSREMMKEHHDKVGSKHERRKLAVTVLQQSAWPFGRTAENSSDNKNPKQSVQVDLPENVCCSGLLFSRAYGCADATFTSRV
jgi:cullin-4